jgi:hypothetical protein
MSYLGAARWQTCVPLAMLLAGLVGCGDGRGIAGPATVARGGQLSGRVHGGQQPVMGATIQLYAAGTSGDGSASLALIGTTVTTSDGTGNASNANANAGNGYNSLPAGNFTITGDYGCPSSSAQVYLVSAGGNPGLAAGTNNKALTEAAFLGGCGALLAAGSGTTVNVTEVTTVGAAGALSGYMKTYAAVGSGTADLAQFTTQIGVVNELVSYASGTAPGPALPSGYSASTALVDTLSDVIAACVNSSGGAATSATVNDGTSCGRLFSYATPAGGVPPSDTIGALVDIFSHPAQNVASLYGLLPAAPPYQPDLASAPATWQLAVGPNAVVPVISPNGGSFTSAEQVTIADATPGSTIYYTTDGSAATTASSVYTVPLTVSSSETIKAFATANGSSSATATAVFSAQPRVVLLNPSPSFTAAYGATSAAQIITIENNGPGVLAIAGITLLGANAASFNETTTCGATVASSDSCTITVSFTATVVATVSATISIADNAYGSPQVVNLSGTGTAPTLTLSPTSLVLNYLIGTPGATQAVTLTNPTAGVVSLGGIGLTGANASTFTETTTCGATLAAGASCSVSIGFSAGSAGTYSASLTITDNAPGSPQTVALSGTSTLPTLTLSATSLSLVALAGTPSAAQTVTIANPTAAVVNLSGILLTGTNASDFTEQGTTCGATLGAGASCGVTLVLNAEAAGTYSASLAIADNATGSPQTVALTGLSSATALAANATTLSFTTPAETPSAAQTVTITNVGGSSVVIDGVTLTGTNAASFNETTTCGATLGSGGSCAVTVTFSPFLAMSYSATLNVANSASGTAPAVALSGTGSGTLTINTSNPNAWVISTGAVTLGWDPVYGNVSSIMLAGSTTQLIDSTITYTDGTPYGLYEDDSGDVLGGTVTTGFTQVGNQYIDWWQQTASNAADSNAFTETRHFIVTANDPGFHVYNTTDHAAADITGGIGTLGKTFRINQTVFTNTYSVNAGLNALGVENIPLPSPSVYTAAGQDPGRAVENAVQDLHGLPLPAGYGREFETKYDYGTQAYLHQEHGLYGTKYGAWIVLPNADWRVGGPTKQSLCFTYNILSQEFITGHLLNGLFFNVVQGTPLNRMWGPNYYHFNQFSSTLTTPAQMYADAQAWLPSFHSLYDNEATLESNGYVASTARGTVAANIAGGGSAAQYAAWTVLSDPKTNFQYSVYGHDYWVNQNATGTTPLTGVVPGTYRLSSYVLGQWGELRRENVTVGANQTTTVNATFTPENFGTSVPIWTIGTPDRSSHEFLHGSNTYGNPASCNGCEDREYWGTWNYWQDFAATNGTQVYYATAVGSTPATDNPTAVNYNQWGTFDPQLYAGLYNVSDDTTDGYNYIIPTYVASLPGATGTNGIQTPVPPLTIHFTTDATQLAQGQYAVVSVALACTSNDVFATLNGQGLVWHAINGSDCAVRSGLSGYYQWIVFQWPTSALNAAGADNLLTLGSNHGYGVMWDAMRMEITGTSAAPSVTGWNDYEFLTGKTYTPANDTLPNN